MSNNISFMANVVADAELKQAGQNDILEVRLANNVGFGEKKVTNWFTGTLWGVRGKSLAAHLTKGKKVFVTGQYQLREYDKKDGSGKGYSPEVRINEIDFADSAPSAGGAPKTSPAAGTTATEEMPF